MPEERWDLMAVGVNRPSGSQAIPPLKGAEMDAHHWHLVMRRQGALCRSSVLTARQATWEAMRERLGQLRQPHGNASSLLWAFSGYGTRLFPQQNAAVTPRSVSHHAVCFADQPVTPEQFRHMLDRYGSHYARIVLILDAAFCVPACHAASETFQESVLSERPFVYAPLRSIHPSYLHLPGEGKKTEEDGQEADWTRSQYWKDLERQLENVQVILGDTDGRYAWEASSFHQDPRQRRCQGVFSMAAQQAVAMGPPHHPWENLTTTRRLIPRRYFPQHMPQ